MGLSRVKDTSEFHKSRRAVGPISGKQDPLAEALTRRENFVTWFVTSVGSFLESSVQCMCKEEIGKARQLIEKNGGDDETRTRDLCRDSTFFNCWPTQNQEVRRAVVGNRWVHWAGSGQFCSTVCSTAIPSLQRGELDSAGRSKDLKIWLELSCHVCGRNRFPRVLSVDGLAFSRSIQTE
jgi:hypothetical protein